MDVPSLIHNYLSSTFIRSASLELCGVTLTGSGSEKPLWAKLLVPKCVRCRKNEYISANRKNKKEKEMAQVRKWFFFLLFGQRKGRVGVERWCSSQKR